MRRWSFVNRESLKRICDLTNHGRLGRRCSAQNQFPFGDAFSIDICCDLELEKLAHLANFFRA